MGPPHFGRLDGYVRAVGPKHTCATLKLNGIKQTDMHTGMSATKPTCPKHKQLQLLRPATITECQSRQRVVSQYKEGIPNAALPPYTHTMHTIEASMQTRSRGKQWKNATPVGTPRHHRAHICSAAAFESPNSRQANESQALRPLLALHADTMQCCITSAATVDGNSACCHQAEPLPRLMTLTQALAP